MEQKSAEWFSQRLGKFTASEFHKLMTSGRGKDEYFGKTAISYIDSKITEILTNGTGCDFQFQGNKATEWGEYCEPLAREKYTEKKGIAVKECGFIEISERFGGSPDGLIEGGIIEIKCPFNPDNHVQNLWLANEADFEKAHYEYYIQMHVNMIATNSQFGDFISFDPRMQNESFQLKVLRINRNEATVKEIKERYSEALKILNAKIQQLFKIAA